MNIDGNVDAIIQVKSKVATNEIGEDIQEWKTIGTVEGYLSYLSGGKHFQHNIYLKETTNLFMCDYKKIKGMLFSSENARIIIDGLIYEIVMIDDPMNLHDHLEIYMKFNGISKER